MSTIPNVTAVSGFDDVSDVRVVLLQSDRFISAPILNVGLFPSDGSVPVPLPSYTVATVPSAATNARSMIYVSNEAGGAVPAFSDGTNWRRVTDRAIVS